MANEPGLLTPKTWKVSLRADDYHVAPGSEVNLIASLEPPFEPSAVRFDALDEGTIRHRTTELAAIWTAVDEQGAPLHPRTMPYDVRVSVTDADGVSKNASISIRILNEPSITIELDRQTAVEGETIVLTAMPSEPSALKQGLLIEWRGPDDALIKTFAEDPLAALLDTTGLPAGTHKVTATMVNAETGQPVRQTHDHQPVQATTSFEVTARAFSRTDTLSVSLQRSTSPRTPDQALWTLIRNRTKAMAFSGSGYKDFIDDVLCRGHLGAVSGNKLLKRQLDELPQQPHGMAAYDVLKTATQAFLLLNCSTLIDKSLFNQDDEAARLGEAVTIQEIGERLKKYFQGGRLPYLDRVINAAFPGLGPTDSVFCYGVLSSRAQSPCLLELIWSYWHEEGMLVQTMNTISRRFQNIRGPTERDPLAHLEIDPLRPLNNLLWGYIQDEQNLLSVKRRAYEYDHHYGLTIYGKAVPALRTADSRSKFLEGFHNLLHMTSVFYKEDNDTTVIADGYPLLNALREVHLLLAQGAHNQFGDLPWTARAEMLIQQWLLARQEMRDFLQSRAMVPYTEAWMPQVDTMKTLQGWSDVTVTHFHDLAVYGEQILLSIRYGDWMVLNDENYAKNWARYWRPEIQGYLHAYRAVTGVDLTNPDTVDPTVPAVHLQKRLAVQRAR